MSELQRALQQLRKKGAFLRGLLGDFEGNITVTGRPGYLINKTGESRRGPGIPQMQNLRGLSNQFG